MHSGIKIKKVKIFSNYKLKLVKKLIFKEKSYLKTFFIKYDF